MAWFYINKSTAAHTAGTVILDTNLDKVRQIGRKRDDSPFECDSRCTERPHLPIGRNPERSSTRHGWPAWSFLRGHGAYERRTGGTGSSLKSTECVVERAVGKRTEREWEGMGYGGKEPAGGD